MTPEAPITTDGPLVSVVIPVFNRAHLVERAIGSVLAQTYRNFEIVVVDDASTDDLTAALSRIAWAQMRRVVHPHNRGAAAARNTGRASSQHRGNTRAGSCRGSSVKPPARCTPFLSVNRRYTTVTLPEDDAAAERAAGAAPPIW